MKEENMQQIDITTTDGKASRIFIGTHAFEQAGELCNVHEYSKVFVLTDDTVGALLLEKILKVLPEATEYLSIPPGEKAKNISTVQDIWKTLHRAGCDRKSLVINLGGGVVCDMGGFAASTYMRGMEFVNVPTTLLAQIDASVGGKTGIDFDGVKNLIGTFDQPQAVIIDPMTLQTLPTRAFIAGFGEIIKHGLINDRAYLQQVTEKSPSQFTPDELGDIIAGSCRIKAEIVRRDEKEGGLRKILNFGHTVGHAIEALSLETDEPLLHGEAIAIGMVVEAALSERKGLLSTDDVAQVEQYIKNASLPVIVPSFPLDRLIQLMGSDKKNQAGSIRFTLLKTLGEAVYDQEVAPDVVREVLASRMKAGDA